MSKKFLYLETERKLVNTNLIEQVKILPPSRKQRNWGVELKIRNPQALFFVKKRYKIYNDVFVTEDNVLKWIGNKIGSAYVCEYIKKPLPNSYEHSL